MSKFGDLVPAVFIILPGMIDDRQDSARKSMQRAAERLGFACFTRRVTEFAATAPGESGRKLRLLEPFDGQQIYDYAHERAVAVLQMGDARVLLDPEAKISSRNSISLHRFVRYKAFFGQFGRVDRTFDPTLMLDEFEHWRVACECEGERDARCLPLHVFSPDKEWSSIDGPAGVQEFELKHGTPTSRLDSDERVWKPAKALHGKGPTRVAGVELREGFHWDVSSPSGSARLSTTTEVWKFRRGSYCNIYPNGAVRQGQSAGGHSARRTFQAPRPLQPPDDDGGGVAGGAPESGGRRRRKRRR